MSLLSTVLKKKTEENLSQHASSPSPASPAPWPCPHCGRPVEIEAVEPRQSDGMLLTFWHCPSCPTWAVTPATLREPPIWVIGGHSRGKGNGS